jgi:hypothetical protein
VEPAGQDSSSAQRQIKPPPISQHLREFGTSWHAWAVLGRNLIPVVGIYVFGWSAALAVFNYWFDGLAAVAAITAAVVPRVVRESHTQAGVPAGLVMDIVRGLLTWTILMVAVGLPYWIVLIPLHGLLLGPLIGLSLRSWSLIGHIGNKDKRNSSRPCACIMKKSDASARVPVLFPHYRVNAS